MTKVKVYTDAVLVLKDGEKFLFENISDVEVDQLDVPYCPTKICSHCKKEKELKEFSLDRTNKTGLHHRCKECKNIYNRLYNAQRALDRVKG